MSTCIPSANTATVEASRPPTPVGDNPTPPSTPTHTVYLLHPAPMHALVVVLLVDYPSRTDPSEHACPQVLPLLTHILPVHVEPVAYVVVVYAVLGKL
mgnify:CR=1 FL=1